MQSHHIYSIACLFFQVQFGRSTAADFRHSSAAEAEETEVLISLLRGSDVSEGDDYTMSLDSDAGKHPKSE